MPEFIVLVTNFARSADGYRQIGRRASRISNRQNHFAELLVADPVRQIGKKRPRNSVAGVADNEGSQT